MSTDGAGHGGHGGLGSDIGHSPGLANADLDVGHGHHGGHTFGNHHGGFSHDGKVTTEALMVAFSHSGAPSFSAFGHANSSVDAHSGMPDHGHVGSWSTGDGVDSRTKTMLRNQEAFYKAVDAAKKDTMRRFYGVHVVSHGYLDVPRAFKEMALSLGAIRVCGTTGNFNPTDVSLNDLTDWSKFTPPYSRKRPPAGWYPKASGVTHVFRQYWQVGPKKQWWRTPKGRPVYDRLMATYLEVNIVTWYFAAIGDYETRIDMKIVSLPILDTGYDKRWGFLATPLKRHQDLSQALETGLFDALKFAKPTEWARARRAKLVELQTTKPAEVEKSGADLDSLFATISAKGIPPVVTTPVTTPAAVTPSPVAETLRLPLHRLPR